MLVITYFLINKKFQNSFSVNYARKRALGIYKWVFIYFSMHAFLDAIHPCLQELAWSLLREYKHLILMQSAVIHIGLLESSCEHYSESFVPWKARNSLTLLVTMSFSRRTVLFEVRLFVIVYSIGKWTCRARTRSGVHSTLCWAQRMHFSASAWQSAFTSLQRMSLYIMKVWVQQTCCLSSVTCLSYLQLISTCLGYHV